MKVNFSSDEEIINEDLKQNVNADSKLKEMIVEYVGEVSNPEDNNVTTEMIVNVFASEFPEFLMAVAEENFIRGYDQGVEDTNKFLDEENCGNPIINTRPGSE